MQEKARIFRGSWCYSRFLIHFSIRKKWLFCAKASILIRLNPTYLHCIADQTRSKYDQPTPYRRPPRCTPAQHTTSGERDHPRSFFNRFKNWSRSPQPLRAGPTNPRCILHQHTLSSIKARSLPIRQFFKSGRERALIGSLVWTGLLVCRVFKWNYEKLLYGQTFLPTDIRFAPANAPLIILKKEDNALQCLCHWVLMLFRPEKVVKSPFQ